MNNKKIYSPIYVLIPLIIFISGFSFYWYELRPSQVRKSCNEWKKTNQYDLASIHTYGEWMPVNHAEYVQCLREHNVGE